MFRNKEFKDMVKNIIGLHLLVSILGLMVVNFYMSRLNENLLEKNRSLIGLVLTDYPELETSLVPKIIKGADHKDYEYGREVLGKYGYGDLVKKDQQVSLDRVYPNIYMGLGILSTLSLFLSLTIIFFGYSKIYKKVDRVSQASDRVIQGEEPPILSEEGEGYFHILNHQFNQMSKIIENNIKSLKEDKKFLKNNISDISHQLKTPLSSLIMLNDLMLEDGEMGEETRFKFLNTSKTQLERMEWLIINLLKMARIEAGGGEFKEEETLFITCVDSALKQLESILVDQEITIIGDRSTSFIGDMEWTTEALINIIKNAKEHGKGRIEIGMEKGPVFASLMVRDNGCGIDKDKIPYVFERFYRIGGSKSESIGIGLNMSKLIIEKQGGIISLTSERGVGTEFRIRFLL